MAAVGFSWGASKPPAGTELDRSHPLCDGLVTCFPINEGAGTPNEVAKGRNVKLWVPDSSPVWRGQSILRDGTVTTAITGPAPNLTSIPFTLAALYQPTAVASTSGILSVGSSLTTRQMPTLSYVGSSGYRFDLTGDIITGTFTPSLTKPDVVVGVLRDSLAKEIWINGFLANSGTAGGLCAPNNTSMTLHGIIFTGGAGRLHGVWIWNRALSPAEVTAFSAQPFQMFLPPVWRRSWPVAVAAPPSFYPYRTLLGVGF